MIFKFCYTSVLLQDGDNFYKARSPQGTTTLMNVDTSRLEIEPTPVPFGDYCPPFSHELTIAPSLMPEDCWEKLPNLSCYTSREPACLRKLMLREARNGEILIDHLPNVATYHGCIGRGGCIADICFTRYYQNLVDHDTRPFDSQDCP